MNKNVVIYHAQCNDGFTAAWVVNRNLSKLHQDIEFIACNYTDPINNQLHDRIRGNNIFVVDFSFRRQLMEQYHSIANEMVVLDHHETAQADCAGLDYCKFDMSKSGAMLAWEHFYPGVTPSRLVQYVQDRDLWKFNLPDSKEVNAVLGSYERTFDIWDKLHDRLENHLAEVVFEGTIIKRLENGHIGRAVTQATTIEIQGYRVPVINNPNLISEVVSALAKDQPFAAAFFMRQDGNFVFSLRSRGDMNVAKIAEKFPGGGGHKAAAGFTVPMETFIELHKTIRNG